MKRFIVIAAIVALCFALSVLVSADGEGTAAGVLLDDMSSVSQWGSVSGTISFMRYSDETLYLSSGGEDAGYLSVRNNDAVTGAPLEVSRSFDAPVDLFRFDGVGFSINITDPGTAVAISDYVVTLTLYSRGPSYSYKSSCPVGEWTRITAPIGDYSLRTDIIGISVSVTAVAGTPEGKDGVDAIPVRLAFRLDAVSASSPRDTAFEEKFLCASFESRGGILSAEDGAVTLSHISGTGRLSGFPVIRDRENAASCDMIRFTVTETSQVRAVLEVIYLDGSTYTSDEKTVAAGVGCALCFLVDDIGSVYSMSLSLAGEGAGKFSLLGVSLVNLPENVSSGIGSLDLCRVLSGGEVNLRGSVPAGTVVDYMDGKIEVYCVPISGEIKSHLETAVPCAEVNMTTRFNINIDPSALPSGYRAMRFLAVIRRKDEVIMIGKATLPGFADDVGAKPPIYGSSIKGLITERCDISAGSAVTFIDVDAGELFGSAASGRIYSFGGRLYYFDNDYITRLDSKIKTASLTGTACFLRLSGSFGGVSSTGTETELLRLYAAVDYLSQRYSSAERGFIGGIAVSGSSSSEATARVMSAIYQIGRGRIAGFRVMLSVKGPLVGDGSAPDSADTVVGLSVSMNRFGSVGYDIVLELPAEESPSLALDAASALTDALPGVTPTSYYVIVAPKSGEVDVKTLLSGYAEEYYEICGRSGLRGLILSLPTLDDDDFASFSDYFFLLDTDAGGEADAFLGIAPEAVSEAARPRAYRSSAVAADDGGYAGYDMFDFTDTFDTAGWFSIGGKCSSVMSNGARALRADDCPGIARSFLSPVDFSSVDRLGITAFAEAEGEFILTVFSTEGCCRAELSLGAVPETRYVDIGELPGASSVTGIALVPKAGSATVFVSGVSLLSRSMTESQLSEHFSAGVGADAATVGEDNLLEVMAVAMLSVAFGVAAVAMIGYGAREKRRGA